VTSSASRRTTIPHASDDRHRHLRETLDDVPEDLRGELVDPSVPARRAGLLEQDEFALEVFFLDVVQILDLVSRQRVAVFAVEKISYRNLFVDIELYSISFLYYKWT